jgi:hypothetical protein
MGLLGKIFAVTAASKAFRSARADRAPQSEYIPAGSNAVSPGFGSTANAVLDRAGQIYKQNPKLVGGIALLGAAALLASIKRGR